MNHEGEVRLVKSHPQRRRRYKNFDTVAEQCVFQLYPTLPGLARVRFCLNTSLAQPLRHLRCIANCERVNDAASRDRR